MMSLSEMENLDRLTQLCALRDVLASAIDTCESMRDLSSLARQYRETVREIDILEGGENDGDEIASIILRHRKSGANG